MAIQVLPFPFEHGIDQTLNTVVGPPCIEMVRNARYTEPGRIELSPGYYWDTALGTTQLREVAQVGTRNLAIKEDGYLYLETVVRGSSGTILAHTPNTPAAEAPIRVDVSPSSTNYNWDNPGLSTDLRVYAMPLGGSKWLAIMTGFATYFGHLETFYALYDADQRLDFQRFALVGTTPKYCQNCGVAVDQTTGLGYFWFNYNGYFWIATYDPTSQTWTNILQSATYPINWIRDVAITTKSGVKYAVMLDDTNHVYTWNLNTLTLTTSFAVTPTPSIGVTAYGALSTQVTVISDSGWVACWDYTTGARQSLDTQIPGVASLTSHGKATISQAVQDWNGIYVFAAAVEGQDAHGVPCVATGYGYSPSNATQSVNWNMYYGGSTGHASLAGRPFPLTTINNNYTRWFVPVVNDHPVSRAYRVQYFGSLEGSESPSNRCLAMGCQGELPLASQVQQGKGGSGGTQFGPPVRIIVTDSLTGGTKNAIVFPFATVASGELNTAACQLNCTALIVPLDSVAMPAGGNPAVLFDGLKPLPIDANASIIPCGSPWLDGAMSLAAGFRYDSPTPVPVAGSAGAVFTSGAVYQYVLVAEFRDASNNLYRSAPSQPVSFTPGSNLAGIGLDFSWPLEAPNSPGLIRVYRTLANGYVFYDTGLVVNYNFNPFLNTVYDTAPDSTIQGNPILYTQAQNALGGLKPKYGVPPCRFACKGKDRILVGGLEKPNRVRWSLTFVSGEGLAFPHAQEAGWFQDFPEKITAVWNLDDTWVIFSRSKIWLVYGVGPDDNGTNGSFEPPRLISPNIGALSWRSLGEIPEGLVFQAADSQIYLLVRGQYQVTWFSACVKDELFRGMSGNCLLNPIVGVTVHQSKNTVHFWRAPFPDGVTESQPIVYDARLKTWSVDGDQVSDGLMGSISAGSVAVPKVSGTGLTYPTVAGVTPNHLTIEANGNGIPAGIPSAGAWTALVSTNDVSPFGFGGWGRFANVGLISDAVVNASFNWSLWRNRHQGAADESGSVALSDGSGFEDYPLFSFAPAADKMGSCRVQISWTERTLKPAGLVFSVDAAQRIERNWASRRA